MSIWSKIGDALTHPAFQVGAGIIGLGTGGGAFGETAANIGKGLNLASGAARMAKGDASWENALSTGINALSLGSNLGLFGGQSGFGGSGEGGGAAPARNFSNFGDTSFGDTTQGTPAFDTFGGGAGGESGSLTFKPFDAAGALDEKKPMFDLKTSMGPSSGAPGGAPGVPAMAAPGGPQAGMSPVQATIANMQRMLQGGGMQGGMDAGKLQQLQAMGLADVPDQRYRVWEQSLGLVNQSLRGAAQADNAALQRYRMAQVEAQAMASLDSPNAQGWMNNYTTAATTELDKQYKLAQSAMNARHSRRGVSDSTVAASERTQLEAKYAEARARIASDARNEWLKYASGMIGNYNAALKPGATEAELLANQAARQDALARQALTTAASSAAPSQAANYGSAAGKAATTRA